MDGGSAFPQPGQVNGYGEPVGFRDEGMTLLDYFAAKALPELLDSSWSSTITEQARKSGRTTPAVIALCAYDFADAMLVERERRARKSAAGAAQ